MSAAAVSDAGQYLTFTLGDEDFAVEIGKVREVLDYPPITRVPRMPVYLRGVTNLRGNVVPVVDMRLKFGLSAIERTVDTCVIIVDAHMEDEVVTMGCLADSVQEVIELAPERIEPPPHMGTNIATDFLRGMGKLDDRFLMLLDIDKVLSATELAAATGGADQAAGAGTTNGDV
jgi:purine-binding chemotaxis protein CheW